MKSYITKTYKPAELEAAIAVLQECLPVFSGASSVVLELYKKGYRIIKTGSQNAAL